LNQNDLGPINDDSQQDFDQTLLGLLNRIYTINNRNLNDIESDIAITYILRNRAAHHLSSSPALLTRFSDVCQGIFNVIFFCVDVLYQPSS
jgi:hypothetical protein